MPIELHLDPELEAVVDESRRLAESMGDLRPQPRSFSPTAVPTAVAETITQWLDDGGYADAVSRIAAEDPDLANQ